MIRFEKKTTGPQLTSTKAEDVGSEKARKKATEKKTKDDTDGARRRAQQTSEDSRLI